LARLFEKTAASQLYKFCETFSIIPQEQFGFRQRSNCELALLHGMDSWLGSIDAGKMVGSLLIDMSKAFDSVPHQLLLEELHNIGCGQEAMKWFGSYLSNREQRVTQTTVATPWKPVTQGVPQGSGLSPLLFNIFVRKLPAACSADTLQFADDVTNSVADTDAAVIARKLTDSFYEVKSFCDEHHLKINAAKTQLVVFKTPSKRLPDSFEIVIDGCTIKPDQSVKLLGVMLDQHLTMGEHVDKIVKKCSGLLGALSRAVPFLPRGLLRLAYIALVRSHLEYASALLVPVAKTHLKKLDVVQKRAARIICETARDAHSAPLMELLQLQPLETRRNKHVVDIVTSILEGNCHPAFREYFRTQALGRVECDFAPRIRAGEKRFRKVGAEIYNNSI
jgi:ribonuclease P/MRP protein subunit RPP40